MAGMVMELGNKELEKIGDYVRAHLCEWMHDLRGERELDLIERVIRVEEELKNLREAMDTRFNLLRENMDRRFEIIDQRFETIDQRFDQSQKDMDRRFTAEREYTEKHFEVLEKRLDSFEKRFSVLQWTMGLGFTILAVLMGVFNFF